ncbi:MAG: Rho-binding antiterminator [Oceanospirillaceae bacterium]
MISCAQYDYIEIVCMFNYPVKLTLNTGEIIEGVALDTLRNQQREELIKIKTDNRETLVVLDVIVTLQVCIENPHFQEIIFD